MLPLLQENRKPTFSERINSGMQQSVQTAMTGLDKYQQFQDKEKENQKQQQQQQAIEKYLGPESRDMPKEFQQKMLEGNIQQRNKASELSGNHEIETRDFNIIKDNFGEKFANVWRSSPVGGRTELLKHAIDASQRGINLEEVLSGVNPQENQIPDHNDFGETDQSNKPQMKNNKISSDYKWPNFSHRPSGYTPKEWADTRKDWRKENVPVFTENKKKLKNRKQDVLSTKKLTQLNSKMPDGIERMLINPETNDFYGPAQVAGFKSPQAQEWSKVISRFQTRAKDTFGSRVTNFDLQSYMQQFPGLLNTQEGRSKILRMMDINYSLDDLYDQALDQVYKKYGLDGVAQEEADKIASELISDETKRLEDEFLGLENQSEPKKLSGKMIDVIGPDGQTYELDQSEVEELPEGFRLVS